MLLENVHFNEIQASEMFTDLIFEYICIYKFVHMFFILIFSILYTKFLKPPLSLCSVFYNVLVVFFCFVLF